MQLTDSMVQDCHGVPAMVAGAQNEFIQNAPFLLPAELRILAIRGSTPYEN